MGAVGVSQVARHCRIVAFLEFRVKFNLCHCRHVGDWWQRHLQFKRQTSNSKGFFKKHLYSRGQRNAESTISALRPFCGVKQAMASLPGSSRQQRSRAHSSAASLLLSDRTDYARRRRSASPAMPRSISNPDVGSGTGEPSDVQLEAVAEDDPIMSNEAA